jgi:hypothetical protein
MINNKPAYLFLELRITANAIIITAAIITIGSEVIPVSGNISSLI